ncbi:PTS system IIA component, Fru family [Candidatus Kryptonium thompsonii]|uniref:PTS system IIA component, Fru family n=1 Tax=Candidatus Kryptonium thompsonii TaxID=1633631 RepID=A0A0P1MBQ8_9BACT|nr:PTS sugar transporter subunit IIA [Candidatus Kryptonium thompsoni]CUS78116.1 PTS system IIA component, Fru family [Candidatus Kryptonium thompsoni]CUS79954.1 PTS system IIA component, Fru family [Candidatus Kryptonium thompsoni]CUS83970.1 PTS system IIA component, Fru family [Candidatus Kryptonium thompsoni]CUS84932.1 PTS system IIA component, Fru family [Candidatus Kryptonium thompsoni]CUS87980.1 PTS system IIA component, Fru family [Candidatus Kryptonium thompsoni]
MKISDILTEDFVIVGLDVSSKEDAINALIDLIAKSDKVININKVREAVFEREKIMTTGVGKGFAVPHGKTDAVTDIVAAFAITKKPIDYDSLDGEPVRLIFLLVGRDNMVGPHIKLLSRISKLMNDNNFRDKLINAKDPKEVVELFKIEEDKYLG